MKGILFSLLAAVCASLSNLFFRKNSQFNDNANGYLVCFYLSSFIFSLCLFPQIWQNHPNVTVIAIGSTVGILNVAVMLLISFALKKGPSGLTFAFLNASAIFPGLLLYLALGPSFGFSCSYTQMAGMVLVLVGLFWGTKNEKSDSSNSNNWLKYIIILFSVQILALSLIQGRCVFFDENKLGPLSTLAFKESDDIWFMPGLFGAAFLWQLITLIKEKRKIVKHEIMYGLLGGISNFSATGLLLLSTKWAQPFETAMIFPCYAVTTILICNLWAKRLYKEEFNYISNALCTIGIFLGVL